MIVDKSVRELIDALESKDSTIVGGSAAAAVGSIGTSLLTMVGNLTFGKKSYESLDAETKKAFEDSFEGFNRLKNELYVSVDRDQEVFEAYMSALQMPRDTDEQKAVRDEALATSTVEALEVPLETAKQGLGILRLAKVFANHGNKYAITDVGVGSLMAYAAIEGALFNVIINLNGIKDEAYAKEKKAENDAILAEAKELRDEILAIVYSRI